MIEKQSSRNLVLCEGRRLEIEESGPDERNFSLFQSLLPTLQARIDFHFGLLLVLICTNHIQTP
jgi:hypothetical protein